MSSDLASEHFWSESVACQLLFSPPWFRKNVLYLAYVSSPAYSSMAVSFFSFCPFCCPGSLRQSLLNLSLCVSCSSQSAPRCFLVSLDILSEPSTIKRLCKCKCSQPIYTSWYHEGFQQFSTLAILQLSVPSINTIVNCTIGFYISLLLHCWQRHNMSTLLALFYRWWSRVPTAVTEATSSNGCCASWYRLDAFADHAQAQKGCSCRMSSTHSATRHLSSGNTNTSSRMYEANETFTNCARWYNNLRTHYFIMGQWVVEFAVLLMYPSCFKYIRRSPGVNRYIVYPRQRYPGV